jgi:L-fuconolactonase
MVVVDTHCHASLDWYEPIETLLYEMDRNAVDHAVLVQINGQFDNAYQFDCVRRYPGRFANVVMVDTDLDEVQQARRKAVFGLARFPNTYIKVTGPQVPFSTWPVPARRVRRAL